MTQKEADQRNKEFFDDWRNYIKRNNYQNQIDAIRALGERGDRSQQPHLVKWSAIINDPSRVGQLWDAAKNSPGENITSGNQDLAGTPFARFAAVGSIPGLPGSTPLSPNDVRPLPGFLTPTDTFGLPGFSAPNAMPPLPGFTPSNPLLRLPGFGPAPAGFAGQQTLARSPAQSGGDRFAPVYQTMKEGPLPPDLALPSADLIFAPAALLLAAAVPFVPVLLAGAGAQAAEAPALEAAAPSALAAARTVLAGLAGAGGIAATTGRAGAAAPPNAPTPNQIVADGFQSLRGAPGESSSTPLDRSEPDSQPFAARAILPMTPARDGSTNENLSNQRRVSDQTDEINGGPGRAIQQLPATVNRAAQLAGLSDGGLTLGRQTPFSPPAVTNTDFIGLPAVLRAMMSSATGGDNSENFENQRRVADLTDVINGGGGRAIQQLPATVNRTAQLAGRPDGGMTLGQRTPFPPPAGTDTDFIGLPAVLRGIAGSSAQAPTNEQTVGWPEFTPLRPSSNDDLEIPDFLRRALTNIGQSAARSRSP